jgi:hypothetical protein
VIDRYVANDVVCDDCAGVRAVRDQLPVDRGEPAQVRAAPQVRRRPLDLVACVALLLHPPGYARISCPTPGVAPGLHLLIATVPIYWWFFGGWGGDLAMNAFIVISYCLERYMAAEAKKPALKVRPALYSPRRRCDLIVALAPSTQTRQNKARRLSALGWGGGADAAGSSCLAGAAGEEGGLAARVQHHRHVPRRALRHPIQQRRPQYAPPHPSHRHLLVGCINDDSHSIHASRARGVGLACAVLQCRRLGCWWPPSCWS